MIPALMKPLKPHIKHNGCIVKYTKNKEKKKAKLMLLATIDIMGVKVKDWLHFPLTSCSGCNDPECRYDGNDGYFGASW